MRNETYWLTRSDAEFVLGIVEKYGNTTKAKIEQETGASPDDPVYEISVTRHDRNTSREEDSERGYITLRSALQADAQQQNAQLSPTGSREDAKRNSE